MCRSGLTAIATAAMLFASPSAPAAGGADVLAPNVEMRDAHGRRIRLSDFRGRVVVVDLWASWCTSCETSFPVLEALAREFAARGVAVIAVNLDEQRKHADAFLRGRDQQLTVMFDPRATVLKAFGAAGIPTSYIIDRQGIIRYTLSGHTSAFESELRRYVTAALSDGEP